MYANNSIDIKKVYLVLFIVVIRDHNKNMNYQSHFISPKKSNIMTFKKQ